MNTWQDTAKRMAARPEWKWLEGMLMATCLDGQVYPQQRFGEFSHEVQRQTLSYKPIPVLTDWPTVGVILGMVVELAQKKRPFKSRVELTQWGNPDYHGGERAWDARCEHVQTLLVGLPGQALGELWLELTGGDGK